MDRFSYDGSEPKVVAECAHCGREIYGYDERKRIVDGEGYVHYGLCALQFADDRTYDAYFDGNVE